MTNKNEKKNRSQVQARLMSMTADRWARRIAEGQLPPEEARAFYQWIAADPAHEQRFHAAKAMQRELTQIERTREYAGWIRPSLRERLIGSSREMLRSLSFQNLMRPGWTLAGFATMAVACIATVLVLHSPLEPPTIEVEPIKTEIAEVRAITLPDGSLVTLGAASQIDVAFTETERRLTLKEGEAFFEVESDEDRPFVVAAGNTLVRVLGTKFDVSLGTDAIDVAVSEGRVEVIRPDAQGEIIDEDDIKHVLIAGQKVSSPNRGQVRPVSPVETEDVASWRRGELQWADTALKDIVADLNRYSEHQIILGAPHLGELEYTLGVQADEIDEAVSLIAVSLDLKVIDRANGDRILR